jgi:serine/threonine protein kinase
MTKMDQYIGKMLDNRYELLELIGSGGMANVYKAKCHRLNRLVAVKILKTELAQDEDFRRRFHDESQAVAMLSHPNIVSVYDVSRDGELEYIVMELIDGITLKQYMERRGLMDWRESLHFITQIMRGLNHAHSRGIIHRDIKPQNIMILRDGSVKVADFGIACLANAGQTLTNEALGSVHYISPEQARGDRTDARSDIYSAGVVLYEMLTGRLPFEGDSAVSVAIQHLSAVPLTPREINESVPEALELICMKAMNPDPEKRYASASEMVDDLEKFRKDPSVDMDYIRVELEEKKNDEPTQFIPSADVSSAVKKAKKKEIAHKTAEGEETPEEKQKNKKKMMIIIGAFAGAMLLVFLVFSLIFQGLGGNSGKNSHEVPNVLGKTVEEAQNMAGVKDVFTITVIGTREDSKYKVGQIIEQDPAAGKMRKDNLVINVYVCAESQSSSMPDVTNVDAQEAKVTLKNMNLDLQIVTDEQASDKVEKGHVVSTTPKAGESIKKGDTIYLIVSTGAGKVTVPSFLDLTESGAKSKAEELGLTVGNTQYKNNDKSEGTVIGQSIEANTEVDSGATIYFTVSMGPAASQTVSKDWSYKMPAGGHDDLVVVTQGDSSVPFSEKLDLTIEQTVRLTLYGTAGTSADVTVFVNGTPIHSETVKF